MNKEYFPGFRLITLPTLRSPAVGGGGAEPALGGWGGSPGVFQPWEESGRKLVEHSAQPVLAWKHTLRHSSSSFFNGEDMLNIYFIVGNGIIKLVVSIFIIVIIKRRIACGVK